MATQNQIGVVSATKGEVFARNADGEMRRLSVGDAVYEKESIITAAGSAAEITPITGPVLNVAEQQTVAVDGQVISSTPADATMGGVTPLAAAEAARVIQAASDTQDFNVQLEDEAAAAGLTGGGDGGGHSFVDLLRIVEGVQGVNYSFPINPTGQPPQIQGQPPVAQSEPIPAPITLEASLKTEEESVRTEGGVIGNNEIEDPDLNYTQSGAVWGEGANGTLISFSVPGFAPVTIGAGGSTMFFDQDGKPIDAQSEVSPAAQLTVNPDGTYTFTVLGALNHAPVQGENDLVMPLVTLNGTGSNGGQVTVNLTLTVQDDVPTIDVTSADREFNSDTYGYPPVLTTQDAQTIGELSDTATGSFAGLFNVTSNIGADDNGTGPSMNYSLSIGSGRENTGLSSDGHAITLSMEGATIVGSTTAGETTTPIFSVAVDAEGNVTLTQFAEIDHVGEAADGNTANNSVNLLGLLAGSIGLTATATITDGDGDIATDSETRDISGALRFQDDVPTIDIASAVTYTLTVTNYGETSAGYDNSFGYYIKDAAGNPTTGVVVWDNVKLFHNGAVSVTGHTPEQIGFFIIPNGNNTNPGLAADTPVHFVMNETTHEWQAFAGATPLTGTGANVLFDVKALNSDNFDHVRDGAEPGNLNWEDLSGGGDKDYNDINIGTVWSSNLPVLTTQDADTIGTATDTATADFASMFSVNASMGADDDGSQSVGYTLSVGNPASGLSSDGHAITLSMDGTTIVGSTTVGETHTPIFSIVVDATGHVTLSQFAQIDHVGEATDGDAFNNSANLLGLPYGAVKLTANATIMDGDQDTATDAQTIDISTAIRFQDNVPTAVNDSASVIEGGNRTVGNDVVLIIDRSGSMAGDELSNLKSAIHTLFDSGAVHSVFIASFSDTATFHNSGSNGGWYTDLNAAYAAIDGLTASGYTDYDLALKTVTDHFVAPPTGGDRLVSMFLSDGQPNENNGTGSDGIIESDTGVGGIGEETAWINFLANNHFDASYAVGFSGLTNSDVGHLEPIAWKPGEIAATYDATDIVPSAGDLNDAADDSNVIIVSSASDLTRVLMSTIAVTNTATGNILDNDSAGADTPITLVSVLYDGVTHTFDSTHTSFGITTSAGTVNIDNTGHYTFTALSSVTSDKTASIAYTIRDADGDEKTANFTVTVNNVNDAPSGANATVTVNEDTSKVFTAADFGFSDANGDSLAAVKITTLPSAGTLTDNGVAVTAGQMVSLADIAANHLVFTPAANTNGTNYANFTFQVQDNGGTANGGVNLDASPNKITINVTAVNDAPVALITPITYAATEQTNLNLHGTGLSISDIDAGSGSMTVTLSVGEGMLTAVKGNSGASISGSGTSSLTITGTVTQINNLLGGVDTGAGSAGTIVYNDNTDTPSASTTLTLQVSDNGNIGGGALMAFDTATINITAVNDAPIAADDSVLTNINDPSGNGSETISIPTWALQANDSDPEGQALSILGVSESESNFSVSINGSNVDVVDKSGGGAFSYTASDGSATNDATVTIDRAQAGQTSLDGTSNSEILIGRDVADAINGNAGNDILIGNAGNDTLNGGMGNDTLNGGMGNDILSGGTGADTFKWSFGDASVSGTNDKITDFKMSDGDVLDLKDLLSGEHSNVSGNLDSFLSFSKSGSDTVLAIDTNGAVSGGSTQTVTFVGTDLFDQAGLATESSHDLIVKLLQNSNLKTEG